MACAEFPPSPRRSGETPPLADRLPSLPAVKRCSLRCAAFLTASAAVRRSAPWTASFLRWFPALEAGAVPPLRNAARRRMSNPVPA